jgi:hypothetical protein
MSVRGGARSALLAVAALLLFGTLALLVGSLDDLAFHGGKRIARTDPEEDDLTVEAASAAPLTRREKIYATILGGLTLVSIGCVFIFRKLRRELFQYLFTLFALILPMLLGLFLVSRLLSEWFHRSSNESAVAGAPEIPGALVAHPPMWSIAVAAGALAVVLLGLIAVLVLRWMAVRDALRKPSPDAPIDAEEEQRVIAGQAGETARRIRSGGPLRGEVIRCYQEMDRLLSKHRRLRPTYLTPREFEEALQQLGIQSAHIEQLTRLFELVRYGERDDESLAQQALACLDRLHATYGREEPHAPAQA